VALYVSGGAVELVGIVLVASPDVFPVVAAARRGARSLGATVRTRVARWVQRLLRRPGTVYIETIPSSTRVHDLSLEEVIGIGDDLPLERKVELLIGHDVEAQERLNKIERRVTEEVKARADSIASTQREIEDRMTRRMHALLDTHKRLRLIGTALVIGGAVLLNAGNFV